MDGFSARHVRVDPFPFLSIRSPCRTKYTRICMYIFYECVSKKPKDKEEKFCQRKVLSTNRLLVMLKSMGSAIIVPSEPRPPKMQKISALTRDWRCW